MFTIDTNITETQLRGKKLFKVLFSMNIHLVATPETSLEEARSYVFFSREGKNRLSVYIGLHLLLTDRKIYYAYSSNPFLVDELEEAEEDARNFAEDLGAMLDDVDFENMSDGEQHRWIEAQSIFNQNKQPEGQPEKSEVTEVVPAEQIQEVPKQPEPAVEAIPVPEPPAELVQSTSQPSHPEAQKKPVEASEAEPIPKDVPVKIPPLAAVKRRQAIQQRAVTTDIEQPPKQTIIKKTISATSVVSRDREALARLLTSF